ncbi:MAG: rane protein [Bacteroidales bacterium]|jgi:membrane protein|nr:rane protein [Bacteroidales bacterium]MDN5329596.1 rane protein [Bacteroidales bacterium]
MVAPSRPFYKIFRFLSSYTKPVYNYSLRIIAKTRQIVFPGFDGMPIYDVGLFFINGLLKGNISNRASAISYNFLMAIFPTIIVVFTLIPFIPVPNFQNMLLDLIAQFVPAQAWETVRTTVEDIITRPRGGLLSVGFLLTLYFSTNGVQSLADAFNASAHEIEVRPWWKQRLVDLLIVILLFILITLSLILLNLGNITFAFLQEYHILSSRITFYMLQVLRWVVLLILLFLGNSLLYFLLPARRNRFRFFSAGSTLSTLLILATSYGFNIYVNNFSKYNVLYGSIGTLLMLMFWIWINATILLIGFELNASIHRARQEKSNQP